jgi:hypothetical protein
MSLEQLHEKYNKLAKLSAAIKDEKIRKIVIETNMLAAISDGMLLAQSIMRGEE